MISSNGVLLWNDFSGKWMMSDELTAYHHEINAREASAVNPIEKRLLRETAICIAQVREGRLGKLTINHE
jgi:hypothetical protein